MKPNKSLRCVAAIMISVFWAAACYPTSFREIAQESDNFLRDKQWLNVNLTSKMNTLNPVHQNETTDVDAERLFHQPQTVFVSCHEDAIKIVINADLFDTGVLVNARDLWLGADCSLSKGLCCRAVVSGANEYTIIGKVADCGTKVSVTDQTLDYTNVLTYSPVPSHDGVVLLEKAVIPIKCQYLRKYNVNVSAVPVWVPFGSTDMSTGEMDFDFRLMTDDWQYKRDSYVYLLGDTIHMEASVGVANHVPLRVYVDSCVAVPFSSTGDLEYIFVGNNGCFTDGLYSASESRFLPRVQENKLQMILQTFIFHGNAHNLIYIACRLKAVPTTYVSDFENRACSFIDKRWQSVDGDDQVCRSCEVSNQDLLDTDPAPDSPITQALPTETSTLHHFLHLHPDQTLKQFDEQSTSRGLSVSGTTSEWTTVLGPLELVTLENEPTGSSPVSPIEQVYVKPSTDQPELPSISRMSQVTDQVEQKMMQQISNSSESMEDENHHIPDLILPATNDGGMVAHHGPSSVSLEVGTDSGQDGENTLGSTLAVPVLSGSHPTSPTESPHLSQPDFPILQTTVTPETEEIKLKMVQSLSSLSGGKFYNLTHLGLQEHNELEQGWEKITVDPLVAPIKKEYPWSTGFLSTGPVYMNPSGDLPIPVQLPLISTTAKSVMEMERELTEQNSNGILEDPFNRPKLVQGSENTISDPTFEMLKKEGAVQSTGVSSTSAEQVSMKSSTDHPELGHIKASSDQSDVKAV